MSPEVRTVGSLVQGSRYLEESSRTLSCCELALDDSASRQERNWGIRAVRTPSEPYEATRECKTFSLYSLHPPPSALSTLTDASIHPVNNYSGLGILCAGEEHETQYC